MRSTEADAEWLRAFKSRLATPLAPAVAADLPDWLWARLGDAYGDAERERSPAPGCRRRRSTCASIR